MLFVQTVRAAEVPFLRERERVFTISPRDGRDRGGRARSLHLKDALSLSRARAAGGRLVATCVVKPVFMRG